MPFLKTAGCLMVVLLSGACGSSRSGDTGVSPGKTSAHLMSEIVDNVNAQSGRTGHKLMLVPLDTEAPKAGCADGKGPNARFASPEGMTMDAAGNLYIADCDNHVIRKLSPEGIVSTLAGTPEQAGYRDGTGKEAQFKNPSDVAIDPAGNVFVADSGNGTIRKISPSGNVSTLAGRPGESERSVDGQGLEAQFRYPSALSIDPAGNLYLIDSGGRAIRKITPAGAVSTLAGTLDCDANNQMAKDGKGTTARFVRLRGLTVAATGTLYVTDEKSIRSVSPAGVVQTISGAIGRHSHLDGKAPFARYQDPRDIAVDSHGNLYITDDNTIRKISFSGRTSTFAGSPGEQDTQDGPSSQARFLDPSGITVDGIGNVFVSDQSHMVIRRISPSGTVLTIAGTPWDSEAAWEQAIQQAKAKSPSQP